VIHATLEVLLYGLAATASVLTFSAVVVVIRSDRPRTNGIAFLIGFLIGTVAACVLGLLLGQAAVDRLDAHQTVRAGMTILLGAALVVIGLRAQHPSAPATERSSRATAIMTGLKDMRPAAVTSMAGLLGFGGPKRLLLTFLAMATATQADLRGILDVTLVGLYIALSTLVVTVPVAVTLVAGHRASALFDRAQTWLSDNAAPVRRWLAVGIGVLLLLDGVLRLLL